MAGGFRATAAIVAIFTLFDPVAPVASASELDVRDDPTICRRAISRGCLATVGAGVLAGPSSAPALTGRACAEELAVYKACLAYAAGSATPQTGGAAGSTPSAPAASAGAVQALPLTFQGLLNPEGVAETAFDHPGDCLTVKTRNATNSATVLILTEGGSEIFKRGMSTSGRERRLDQFLPAGRYVLAVRARRNATPYSVSLEVGRDC